MSLDPQRASTQMGTILEEVINHLNSSGTHVTVGLEIEAYLSAGFGEE